MKKIKWKKVLPWIGVTILGGLSVKKIIDQQEEINNLKGEMKNLKDENNGYKKTIERQAFTLGKLHNRIYTK